MAHADPIASRPQNGTTTIRVANLRSTEDADSIVRLLDEYACDPMGRGRSLDLAAKERMIPDLAKHPSVIVYLADTDAVVTGLAVCFLQYSTFGAFHLLNIHDFVVTASARKRGIGRALLREICKDARNRGCQKVTLEVRDDNVVAQRLYRREGFGECDPPMLFLQRQL
jgi:ribosomal protein S18 acetylase RimI-like enzyme